MSTRLRGRTLFYIVLLASLFAALFISILLGLIIVILAVIYYVWKGKQVKRAPTMPPPSDDGPQSDETSLSDDMNPAADDASPPGDEGTSADH